MFGVHIFLLPDPHAMLPKGIWNTITSMRLWISRLLILIVTAWNLQAALLFIASPGTVAGDYELSGAAGAAAIRGAGVLFLMWNIPYLIAVLHPRRYRVALVSALLMQLTGLIGESYILSTLTMEHALLRASIQRFILFDGIGLVLLFTAWRLAAGTASSSGC